MAEQLAFWKSTANLANSNEELQSNAPNRCAQVSGEDRWREIVKNSPILPSTILPNNSSDINQGSEGLRYMLVPLPSKTAADRLNWDAYGLNVPVQPDFPLPGASFVNLRDVCAPSESGSDSLPMELDPRPVTRRKSKVRVAASPKKRKAQGTKSTAKKVCSAKKIAAAVHSRPRFVGPATRGNPHSERTPMSFESFDLDLSFTVKNIASSPSSSTSIMNLKCWIKDCPRTFTTLQNLGAHHNVYHPGQHQFVCPFRDSCSHTSTKQGEMKRHVNSVKHLGGASLVCPNGCTSKTFSRLDALRRHLKSCATKLA
ncbi:hypothetical protein J3R30DRAFT_2590282 [Lentinula aciculospora]|uniref:C2H2-type domain-containing protein n=1 Tax=Lentinula aciculospora TaxID=153920 RepID=A0A9W9ADH1_9AGAR|nr:hypothetical protein J3R30DRAFT_2590282 [Lentinula aciculospora]